MKVELTRRAFLRSGIATGVSAAAGTALAQQGPDPLITETQDWGEVAVPDSSPLPLFETTISAMSCLSAS